MRELSHMKKLKIRRLPIFTRYGQHLAVLEPDDTKGFIVTVPDLPGVITWGENISHAKEMAKEAIELCIECLVERSRPRAKPRARSTARIPVRV